MSQSELARRAGISRQALGAIEAGEYLPSVTVALGLARALGESVETLFGADGGGADRPLEAGWTGPAPNAGHTPVALARVGGRLIAENQPAARLTLVPAAGRLEKVHGRQAQVSSFRSPEEIAAMLLIAGCDPAADLLADWLGRRHSPCAATVLPLSSQSALAALRAGRAHVAGVHLRDARSGDYNLAPALGALGKFRGVVVTFAEWEIGFATAPGNPLDLRSTADLARPGLRLVNRPVGAGARAALDEALTALAIAPARIAGYAHELSGHLEVAAAIAAGQADLGVTLRVAADAYGLGFLPLRQERYDLVVPESELGSIPVRAMLDALSSRAFAREISQLCTYDSSRMGQVVGRLG